MFKIYSGFTYTLLIYLASLPNHASRDVNTLLDLKNVYKIQGIKETDSAVASVPKELDSTPFDLYVSGSASPDKIKRSYRDNTESIYMTLQYNGEDLSDGNNLNKPIQEILAGKGAKPVSVEELGGKMVYYKGGAVKILENKNKVVKMPENSSVPTVANKTNILIGISFLVIVSVIAYFYFTSKKPTQEKKD